MTLSDTSTVAQRRSRARRGVAAALLAGVAAVTMAPPATAAGDPLRSRQWALDLIGAPAAWTVGRGAGSTIAVVDSGIDLSHEDLATKVVPGRSFVGGTVQDDDGHGTHVSGTAAAATDNGLGISGVAPDARLLPVKVLTPDGGTVRDVAAGIRYAADAGATVINLSLGPEVPLVFGALDSSLSDAIRYAWSRGAICVLAAGNNGLPVSDYPDLPAIVVTAVDRDDRKAAYATSVGAARWGLAAPGGSGDKSDDDDVLSTYWLTGKAHQYGFLAGTSMAAPHVSGAAAVLRGLGLSPQQTVDRLLATATDLGSRGRDGTYGSGRLDLQKAVQGLGVAARAAPAPAPAADGPAATSSSGAPSPVAPPGRSGSPSTSPGATPDRAPLPPNSGPLPPVEPLPDDGAQLAAPAGPPALADQQADSGQRQPAATDAASPAEGTSQPLGAVAVAAVAVGMAVAGTVLLRRGRRGASG